MALIEVAVDTGIALLADPGSGHNRWHPGIEPIARCSPGDTVVLDTRDAADGQITELSTSADVAGIDLGRVHPLTGPVWVEGAEPGDLLELEIVDLVPATFGFTAISPGFGFLRDRFTHPFLVRWHLTGGRAVSEDLPGVAIAAAPFLGIIGVAPDERLIELSVRREQEALARGDFLAPPTGPDSAVPGGAVGAAGLRTGPPRENGGNLDVRFIGPGARVVFPVLVPGALFSVGDAHFAQGDGEVCGLAIETRSRVRLRVGLVPGGAQRDHITQTRVVSYFSPAVGSRPFVVTTGLSIADGVQSRSEDTTIAARNALTEMVEYLMGRGFSAEQAYVLCSVAVDLRISQIVDVPHATVSAVLPLDIFT